MNKFNILWFGIGIVFLFCCFYLSTLVFSYSFSHGDYNCVYVGELKDIQQYSYPNANLYNMIMSDGRIVKNNGWSVIDLQIGYSVYDCSNDSIFERKFSKIDLNKGVN